MNRRVFAMVLARLLTALAVSSCASEGAESPGTLSVTLGYHPLEGDVTATYVPLTDGQALPVLIGGQGAVMCIVAARLSGPVPEGNFTVDVALRKSNGDPWAFPRVRLAPLWSLDGTAYFANLWLIFADPPWVKPWEHTRARLEITATSLGKDGVGAGIVATAALDVMLTASDVLTGSVPPKAPDVPESLSSDIDEPEVESSPDAGPVDEVDVTDRWADVLEPRPGEE